MGYWQVYIRGKKKWQKTELTKKAEKQTKEKTVKQAKKLGYAIRYRK